MNEPHIVMAAHLVIDHGYSLRKAARRFGLSVAVLKEYVDYWRNK